MMVATEHQTIQLTPQVVVELVLVELAETDHQVRVELVAQVHKARHMLHLLEALAPAVHQAQVILQAVAAVVEMVRQDLEVLEEQEAVVMVVAEPRQIKMQLPVLPTQEVVVAAAVM
jgi:hypothetical protein